MAAHVQVDRSLQLAGFEDRIADTYLGQAHIAGTGPCGTNCRACRHWRSEREGFSRTKSREAYCEYPIPGKRRRLIPGTAQSCTFFDKLETANG